MLNASTLEPPEALREMAQSTRAVYLKVLEDALGEPSTEGACFYAANLMAMVASKFLRLEAAVCGGDGLTDGGYFDPNGIGYGHYWTEVVDGNQNQWVVDLTADQFGGPAVTIRPAKLARDTYRPGALGLIAQHVETHWNKPFDISPQA